MNSYKVVIMPNILIADENTDFSSDLALILEAYYPHYNVITASNGLEAIEVLRKATDVNLVISRDKLPKKTGIDLFKENTLLDNCPFVLLSEDNNALNKITDFYNQNPHNAFFNTPLETTLILESLEDLFTKTVSTNPQYIPIKAEGLFKCPYYHGLDLFIKLNDKKYLRIIKSFGGAHHLEVLQNYQDKNRHTFYFIKSDLRQNFNQFVKNISKTKNNITGKKRAITYFMNYSNELGINEENIELMSSLSDEGISKLATSKMFLNSMKELIDSDHYKLKLSLLTFSICFELLKQTERDVSDEDLKTLSMASLIQDLFLDSELIYIEGVNDPEYLALSKEQKENFNSHIKKATSELKYITDCPDQLIKVVNEHHERPDGKGYPNQTDSSELNFLSSLFSFASRIAKKLIKRKDKKLTQEERNQIISLYNKDNFKEHIDVIFNILEKWKID